MRIQRLRLHGSKDIGDIGNVYWHGRPVCIEVKWTQTMDAPQHMREAVREAGNMDSPYPWVIQKKAGVGLTSMHKLGQQHAYTTDVYKRQVSRCWMRRSSPIVRPAGWRWIR